jgi:hypothetical protein
MQARTMQARSPQHPMHKMQSVAARIQAMKQHDDHMNQMLVNHSAWGMKEFRDLSQKAVAQTKEVANAAVAQSKEVANAAGLSDVVTAATDKASALLDEGTKMTQKLI